MFKKDKKEETKLEYEGALVSTDSVHEVLEEDVNSSIVEFIADKLAKNLEMKINISKDKNTDKLGLSFSVKYNEED